MPLNVGVVLGFLELKDQWNDTIDKARKSKNDFAKESQESFSSIGKAIGLVAAGATAAGAALIYLGQRGAEVADVTDAFKGFTAAAGEDSTKVLKALQDGVVGTISKFELMQKANQAMAGGFELTAESASAITKAAYIQSDAMGTDLPAAYNMLMESLTKGKAKGLEMLGIVIDQKNASAELKAALEAEGSETSTTAQKNAIRAAIMEQVNAKVRDAGDAELDFGDKIQKARTHLTNMLDDLGKAIAQSPVIAAGMDAVMKAIDGAFGSNSQTLIDTAMQYINQFAIALVEAARYAVSFAKFLTDAFYGTRAIIFTLLEWIAQIPATLASGIASMLEMASKIPLIGDQFKGMAESTRGTADVLGAVAKSFGDTADEALTSASDADKMFDKLDGTLANVSTSMRQAATATTEAGNSSAVAAPKIKSVGEAGGWSAEEIKKFKEAMIDINSVGTTMQGTLDTIDGTVVEAIKYYLDLGIAADKLKTIYQLTDVQINAVTDAHKKETDATEKAIEATKKQKEAMDNVNIALNGYDQVLRTIPNGLRNAAEEALKHGASMSDVAAAYGLTDAQVNALSRSMADNKKQMDDNGKGADELAGKYRTLTGEIITLEEAERRRTMGGTSEVTSMNFQQMLEQILTSGGWNKAMTGVQLFHDPYDMARKGYSFAEITKYMMQAGTLPPPQGPPIPGMAQGTAAGTTGGTSGGTTGGGTKMTAPSPSSGGTSYGAPPATGSTAGGGGGKAVGGTSVQNNIYINDTLQNAANKTANAIMNSLRLGVQYGRA